MQPQDPQSRTTSMSAEDQSLQVQEDIELTRASFEAFNRGDIDAVLARLAPDVEVYADPELPNSGTFHGPDGALVWFERWLEVWETFSIDVEEVIPVGDSLVVCVVQHGRGRGSGVEVDMRSAYVVTIRDGRTTRLHLYLDREKALEVARGWD